MDNTSESPYSPIQPQPQGGHPPLSHDPGPPGYPPDSADPGTVRLIQRGRRLAIFSLSTGVLSFLCLFGDYTLLMVFLIGPLGVGLAISALVTARRDNSPAQGMAIAGLALSGVSFLIVLVQMVLGMIIMGIVFWALGRESSAISGNTEETIQVVAVGALPLGTAAEMGNSTITVTGVTANTADSIVTLSSNDTEPGGQNGLADLAGTYVGSGEGG